MNEKAETTDPKSEQEQAPQEPEAKAPALSSVEKENASLKRRLGDLQKKIDGFMTEAEKRQIADLEGAKQYDEVKRKLQADLEARDRRIAEIEAQHQQEITRRDLQLALSSAGCVSEIAQEGFLVRYAAYGDDERPTVSEFIAQQKEAHAGLFATGGGTRQRLPASAAPAAAQASGSNNWAQLKADLNGRDVEKSKAASAVISNYVMEHGEFPPGWK